MLKDFSKSGRIKSVVVITITAIALSIMITMIIVSVLRYKEVSINVLAALTISTLVPLIVSPIISWHVVGLTVKIHDLEEKMRKLATYDSLTGLLTRHAFMERANQYLNIAKRDNLPFSMMILDLDHFKDINDRYGHIAGDKVLASFGQTVQNISRKSDLAGRLGGEEFAFFLPGTSKQQSIQFANRLLEAINHSVIEYKGYAISYTSSIGLIAFPDTQIDDIEELLHLADKTLYDAKKNGRNQAKVYDKTKFPGVSQPYPRFQKEIPPIFPQNN